MTLNLNDVKYQVKSAYIEKMAIIIAEPDRFHSVSLLRVSQDTNTDIREIHTILSKSINGYIDTRGTPEIQDDTFILKIEDFGVRERVYSIVKKPVDNQKRETIGETQSPASATKEERGTVSEFPTPSRRITADLTKGLAARRRGGFQG